MDRRYGFFSERGKAYNITTPNLPRNWYNYLWNDKYVTFVSQTGAGEGFLQDDLGRRINLTKDRGFFILENGEAWGISGLPVNQKLNFYQCTHKMGETLIYTEKNGVKSTVDIIAARKSPCEIWGVTVENTSNSARELSVVAFCQTGFDGGYTRQGYNLGTADYDEKYNAIISKKTTEFDGKTVEAMAFMTASEKIDGYDCTYNAIIGQYGSMAHPLFADNGSLSNSALCGEKQAFAMEKKLILAPNERKNIVFVLGIAFSNDEIEEYTRLFASESEFQREKEEVLFTYECATCGVSVKTPDEKLNCTFEWLKYQTLLGSRWARVRHNGYRDMTSDTDCLACLNAVSALERFFRVLSYQYPNGYAPRTFLDGKIQDKNFADNTVWLNFTAMSIVKEFGDYNYVLNQLVPYNDGSMGTIYEHLKRSVDFLYNFRGHHNLIRIWGGDWNDCMNTAGIKGKGVSVWLSIAWYRANKYFGEMACLLGKNDDFEISRQRGEEMRQIIEEHGWDGEYYLCAYNDDGEKIGSHECDEGKMFLIPQIWAVFSGVSDKGREILAMDAVEKYLSSPMGTLISIPPYTKYNGKIGSVTTKPAGVHENGGMYLHTIAWKIAADAMLGRADKVEEGINAILPYRNPIVNGRAEPYVISNSYFGEQTGYRYGTPGQSWRTAAGPWLMKSLVNYVFGLIPEIEGLRVSPCLPPSWKECEITKMFRFYEYHIKYQNNGTKIKEITVNGEKIDGNILPLCDAEVLVITE